MHICTEMAPVVSVGSLASYVTGLSRALQRKGNLVEVILPKYTESLTLFSVLILFLLMEYITMCKCTPMCVQCMFLGWNRGSMDWFVI